VLIPCLGQASFRLAVLDAYGRQCAVTAERSLPVIDAAHSPVARRRHASGPQRGNAAAGSAPSVRSRLRDDQAEHAVGVSRWLRDDYANDRVYDELDGRELQLPVNDALRPDREALSWHEAELFLGQ